MEFSSRSNCVLINEFAVKLSRHSFSYHTDYSSLHRGNTAEHIMVRQNQSMWNHWQRSERQTGWGSQSDVTIEGRRLGQGERDGLKDRKKGSVQGEKEGSDRSEYLTVPCDSWSQDCHTILSRSWRLLTWSHQHLSQQEAVLFLQGICVFSG